MIFFVWVNKHDQISQPLFGYIVTASNSAHEDQQGKTVYFIFVQHDYQVLQCNRVDVPNKSILTRIVCSHEISRLWINSSNAKVATI